MQGEHVRTPPSPQLLFETINAYQRTAIIKAAIELDVFSAVARGAVTAPAIARECMVAERGARTLCDCLVVMGLLTKDSEEYGLTPDSAFFLDRKSPAYMGGTLEFLLSPTLVDAFKDVAEAVRKGGTVVSQEGTIAPEHPVWVKFARAMAPTTVMPARFIADILGIAAAGKIRVLDIAAGHGMYGVTVARQNPQAEITALDWPGVLEVAKENARDAGVADRYHTLAGSAFETDFGGPYDVILLTNFLHHFDQATCEQLLRKVHGALNPGGKAATLEFVRNEDRVSPSTAALFSMMMLVGTPGGDAYTFSELSRMFDNVGFAGSEIHDMPGSFQQVIVSQK